MPGGIIVAVIYNGVILIGLGAAGQYIWTAIVLLAAAALDALAQRGSNPAKRACGSRPRRGRNTGRGILVCGVKRAPGSVKLRAGGDSPRPGRCHRLAEPVQFRYRR